MRSSTTGKNRIETHKIKLEPSNQPPQQSEMSFRGGRGNRGGFGGNNAFSHNKPANNVEVEIFGWNGASASECIAFIARKCNVNVTNYSVNTTSGGLRGFVRSKDEADLLVKWSGVRFAGGVLRISIINSVPGGFGSSPAQAQGGDNAIETLTQFLKLRYSPDIKLLNLSSVQQDPTLSAKGYFGSMSTTSKFFPALMKIASDLKLDVTSADLSNNNLADLSTISTLAVTFPNLQNLALLNNKLTRIKIFESWKKKLSSLRELILAGNPLLNTNDPTEIALIKGELLKVFPRLVVLDGEILRNEEVLRKNLTLLFERPQAMFFQDNEAQAISTNFITNFYKLWDTDRKQLMVLYQNESQFSFQVDSSHPRAFDAKDTPDFGYYIPQSRNLTRVSSVKAKMGRLAHGQEQIFKLFSQLPKTQHDLMTKPDDFSMESFRLPQLGAICITLHGVFQETGPPDNTELVNTLGHGRNKYQAKKSKIPLGRKGFDRTMIVIPGPNNSMIVASDLLCVRSEVSSEAFRPSAIVTPQPQTTPSPAPVPGSFASPPGVGPSASVTPTPPGANVPTAADLPAEVKSNLNTIQQELLVKILLETKLNIQYGVMLCQQSNWDYQQCITNFKTSQASLPPDAFAR